MNTSLNCYIPIVNMIAQTFGSDCEVVLHDLTHPQNSVVYVVNNTVTGRKQGQSFEHLIKQVLLNKDFKDDYAANYMIDSETGKKIKSSSALIRTEQGEVIGMICVNCDVTMHCAMRDALNEILPMAADDKVSENPESVEEVMTIIDDLIENIIGNANVSSFKRKENLAVVEFMDKKGVFLVKGAIDKVADRMGVSKVTIYSYLDEVRNRKE